LFEEEELLAEGGPFEEELLEEEKPLEEETLKVVRELQEEEKIDLQPLLHRNLCLNHDDPVEVWAYRRIAEPVMKVSLSRHSEKI
jgi:hypothetical protein